MLSTLSSRPLLLAAVLLGAVAPAGFVAQQAASAGCADALTLPSTVDGRIKASTPLSEQFSASETLYLAQQETGREVPQSWRLEGTDAYTHNLGCDANGVHYRLSITEPTPQQEIPDKEPRMELQFYDEHLNFVGKHTEDPDQDVLSGTFPPGTQHVVVVMIDGPLISGIDYSDRVPEPYSVAFDLKLGR